MAARNYTNRELAEQFLELFARRSRWTRWTQARNAKGAEVSIVDPSAARWCLSGAQERMRAAGKVSPASQQAFRDAKAVAIRELFGDVTPPGVPLSETSINDHKGLAAVRMVLRRAGGLE